MATVSFSPAGEVLYAYLAGEIDHDAAQSLRIQLDDALVSRTPPKSRIMVCGARLTSASSSWMRRLCAAS